MAIEHTADRPSWNCRACHDPWPCELARKQLLAEMPPTTLRIYCWEILDEAAADMPNMAISEAFERFFHWSRPKNYTLP